MNRFSGTASALVHLTALLCVSASFAAAQPSPGCRDFAELQRVRSPAATDQAGARAEEAGLREYAVFSYRNIANDLIDGNGPYLDALLAAFAEPCTERTALIAELRRLLAASKSAPDFARRVAIAHALMTDKVR